MVKNQRELSTSILLGKRGDLPTEHTGFSLSEPPPPLHESV